MTSLLDLIGMCLLVAAGVVVLGVGAGLAIAGAGCLVVSWSLSRSGKR